MRHITLTLTLTLALALSIAASPLAAREEEGAGILNATSPAPGILFGGQPTAEQLEKLAAAEYKTVIDLRLPSEDRGYDEAAAAKAAGLEYVPIPVSRETLDEAATLDKFIAVFGEVEKPVLVHCGSGGRVAAVYYAWLVAKEGMSRDEALARAKEQGMRSEALKGPVDTYLDRKAAP